ncbi:hypothetical protein HPB50_009961 [Hyalomma asiaticum]|uniref:Uncharacterized protein n=1 Tax=Hyalomma asiaticum TaxID=266040 RepID=A0ACB7S2P6_HYAAI|nr:hypothetical protein HPB50_009961 [Hyalomma asiaticum]
MASASTPNAIHFKGFDDVLEARPVQPVGDDFPAPLPACSLCSVVSREHYFLSCKHAYCVPCFFGIVKKNASTNSLHCPVDGKNFRPRKELPKSTIDTERVRGLLVRCWNEDNGCGYTGTLQDMPAHFRGCEFYRVTCCLCSASLLRPELASHVEESHAKRRSKRHDAAVDASDDTASKVPTSVGLSEDSKNVGHFPESLSAGDGFRQLAEAAATRAASQTADRINEHNEKFLLEVLSGLELVKDRVFAVAEAINMNFPPRPAGSEDTFHSEPVAKASEQIRHMEYKWVTGTVFQISASLKVHRGEDERGRQLCWPFRRICQFRLIDGTGTNVVRSFTPAQVFNSDDAATPLSDQLVSGWLDIATIDRATFERDYVVGDAVTIIFTTTSLLD